MQDVISREISQLPYEGCTTEDCSDVRHNNCTSHVWARKDEVCVITVGYQLSSRLRNGHQGLPQREWVVGAKRMSQFWSHNPVPSSNGAGIGEKFPTG